MKTTKPEKVTAREQTTGVRVYLVYDRKGNPRWVSVPRK